MALRNRPARSPRHGPVRVAALAVALSLTSLPAHAQDEPRSFAGGLLGALILSADGRAGTDASSAAAMSLYEPESGVALNVFAGTHLAQYFSVQADWIWNRNDLTLFSSFVEQQGGGFYEQRRESSQHAVVLDGLLYFR